MRAGDRQAVMRRSCRRAEPWSSGLGVLRGRLVREVVDAVPDQIGAEAGRAQEDRDQDDIENPPGCDFNLAAPWDGMGCSTDGAGPPASRDQRHPGLRGVLCDVLGGTQVGDEREVAPPRPGAEIDGVLVDRLDEGAEAAPVELGADVLAQLVERDSAVGRPARYGRSPVIASKRVGATAMTRDSQRNLRSPRHRRDTRSRRSARGGAAPIRPRRELGGDAGSSWPMLTWCRTSRRARPFARGAAFWRIASETPILPTSCSSPARRRRSRPVARQPSRSPIATHSSRDRLGVTPRPDVLGVDGAGERGGERPSGPVTGRSTTRSTASPAQGPDEHHGVQPRCASPRTAQDPPDRRSPGALPFPIDSERPMRRRAPRWPHRPGLLSIRRASASPCQLR